MSKYAIGLDYGTLSGRAVLLELKSGREIAAAQYDYPHGVLDQSLPTGEGLAPDWALQHPQDYLDALYDMIPALLRQSGVAPADIVGLGLDFTACTMLPAKADGTPLCLLEQYACAPHAWPKLWKHHAAQAMANRLNEVAAERGEAFLARYGGKISSEWMFPKIMQILEEAPEIYADTDVFLEGGDWVVWQLTGSLTRNTTAAGHKAIWHKGDGYPSPAFFRALDPRLEHVVEEKFSGPVLPQGARAGFLSADMAARTGLREGIAVAVANVDAHVAAPAAGIAETGRMLMIMGTSTCHLVMGEREEIVPGMCGVVTDAILPGFVGFEAGQSCVGDHFSWFARNCVPTAYEEAARRQGVKIQSYLTERAQALRPGQSGLVALDWWNGNRSVLVDVDLTGLMVGMTLQTRPEEVYRALIEATAYGTRMIVDNFISHHVAVDSLCAAGGIPHKNPMLMQIYADVLNKPISVAASGEAPAVGSAMFGAVAAGADAGGYDSILDAAAEMGRVMDAVYEPIPAHVAVYEKLYREYALLHDTFGRGENDVMKRLKAIRDGA